MILNFEYLPNNLIIHTDKYAAHPALLVFALESTSRPLIPKSQSFTQPPRSSRMLDGLTSVEVILC